MLQQLELGGAMLENPTPEQQLALNSAWARAYYAVGNFPKAMEHSELCLDGAIEPSLRHYMYAPSSIMGRALCGSGRFGRADYEGRAEFLEPDTRCGVRMRRSGRYIV